MNEKLEHMVTTQIESRGILSSNVLNAMRSTDRIKFVTKEYLSQAYDDYPLPIGHGQTISQPYIVAFMSELCKFTGTERVLEIGTGSGYQTAILSKLASHVYSMERIPELSKRAEKILAEIGCKNVSLKIGDGYNGWPQEAPFDVIILTAAPPNIPETLVTQIANEGRLIGPEGVGMQQLVIIKRFNNVIEKEFSLGVRFVHMV